MPRIRPTQIVASYVVSLVVVLALLVLWVVYVLQSRARIDELAGHVGVSVGQAHWVVLAVGCGLALLLLIELTSQLANSFAERRYTRKQEEFLATVTHELRTPLAAIKLHAQTLERDDITPQELRRSRRRPGWKCWSKTSSSRADWWRGRSGWRSSRSRSTPSSAVTSRRWRRGSRPAACASRPG
jgi:signal transduction histidine kinase